VTHEPAIADACPRKIRLADGRIVEDARRSEVAC
jgi:predicted ABC-type transport system involved in lysophospholipase L1 biosynthesis ATPase subunit